MGKAQLGAHKVLAQQAGADRGVHIVARVWHLSDRDDQRRRRMLAQHRSGSQERLRCGRERCDSGEDQGGQLPRRRQPALPSAQTDNADLVEQSPTVKSVAFVCVASRDAPRGDKAPKPKRAGQVGEVARTKAAQADVRNT